MRQFTRTKFTENHCHVTKHIYLLNAPSLCFRLGFLSKILYLFFYLPPTSLRFLRPSIDHSNNIILKVVYIMSGIEFRWGRDFLPVQTGPGAHQASCKMGTGSFPGVKCGRGVLLTTHPLLVSQSWKSRAIPLPTLWAAPGL